jgi:hypothetical protein
LLTIVSIGIAAERCVPRLAWMQFQQGGVQEIEAQMLVLFARRHHVLAPVAEHVPDDATLVVIGSGGSSGPVALLHGERVGRRLVYHVGPPDAATLASWREQGIRWACTPMNPNSQRLIDRELVARGFKPVAKGLYELP